MYAERKTVSITTDGSGNGVGYTDAITGRILAVGYVKDGSNPYSNGVDITVTLEATAEAIVTMTDQNASGVYYPRPGVHDETGAAALFAAAGTKLREPVTAAADRVKISVASGGASKIGSFFVVVG
jgi:hypothetical protein